MEIRAAYEDARETIPFGPTVGRKFGEQELFHLAPAVALKFWGLPMGDARLKRVTEAALASYVANMEGQSATLSDPRLAFAFCYLASHFGLGLVENKHSRVEGERARDLDRLTFGDGQHFKRQMDVDSQLQIGIEIYPPPYLSIFLRGATPGTSPGVHLKFGRRWPSRPRRRLTRRCSGLATLAAELHFVRLHRLRLPERPIPPNDRAHIQR